MSSLFGGGGVKIPKVNFAQELNQTLQGFQNTAGGFFGLNQAFSPAYTGLNLQSLGQTLFGFPAQAGVGGAAGSPAIPGELADQTAAQEFLAQQNMALVQQLGPQGYQALLASNPGLAQSLGAANQFGAQLTGPGGLFSDLSNTAMQELSLGGELSPQELTMEDQAQAAGFASRGMYNTNQSLAAQLLGRDSAFNQRLGQRIGWAEGVAGLGPTYGNYLTNLGQFNASVYDPYLRVLGQSQAFGGTQSPLSLMGSLQTQNLFNPQQGADIFNTNLNAQASAAIANANQNAAVGSGALGAIGSIGAGVAIAY